MIPWNVLDFRTLPSQVPSPMAFLSHRKLNRAQMGPLLTLSRRLDKSVGRKPGSLGRNGLSSSYDVLGTLLIKPKPIGRSSAKFATSWQELARTGSDLAQLSGLMESVWLDHSLDLAYRQSPSVDERTFQSVCPITDQSRRDDLNWPASWRVLLQSLDPRASRPDHMMRLRIIRQIPNHFCRC
jgi:hypothetical protein